MPIIPAICDNCGALLSSGIFIDNVTNLKMENNIVGPCPVCGGSGRTKNGVFNVVNGVIKQLKDLDFSKEEILELSETVRDIKNNSNNPEKIEEVIRKSNPKFSFILDLFPKNREEKMNFAYFLIPLLIGLLPYFLNSNDGDTVNYDVNVQQVVNVMYENPKSNSVKQNNAEVRKDNYNTIGKAVTLHKKRNSAVRTEKLGRNQPCPCGSGLKYKKCHGN